MFHRRAGRIILKDFYLVAEIPDAKGVMTCSAIDLNDYVTGRDGKSPHASAPQSPRVVDVFSREARMGRRRAPLEDSSGARPGRRRACGGTRVNRHVGE